MIKLPYNFNRSKRFNNVLLNPKKSIILYSIILVLLILIFLFLIIYFSKVLFDNQIYGSLKDFKTQSYKVALKDNNLARVNTLFQLPLNKSVEYGTITDIKTLQSKDPIFKNAQNGDIIILYSNLTIIYDPVNNYVVSIVPKKLLQ